MLFEARPHRFERLEERWHRGVPSIGHAPAFATANQVRSFIASRGYRVVARDPAKDLAASIFLSIAEEAEPFAALADFVAKRSGDDARTLRRRLMDDAFGDIVISAPGFPDDEASRAVAIAICGPWRTTGELWMRARGLADRASVSCGALLEHFRFMCAPSSRLVTLVELDETSRQIVDEAVTIVEGGPSLRIVLGGTFDLPKDADSHSWSLVREGRFELPYGTYTEVHQAPARASRERTAVRERHSQAEATAAKSLAEQHLFEALERRSTTVGRFALNQRIDRRFGAARAEIDLYDRDRRIGVEVDGFYHFSDLDAYRRDRRKDVLLQQEDIFVIRVLADDVMDSVEGVVDRIADACVRRRPRGAA